MYDEKPDITRFLQEWSALYQSKSGERGIFSLPAARAEMDKTGRRDSSYEFGTNPCGEVVLRSNEFCNLSEVVIRPNDTLDSLKTKVKYATLLGTLQSSLTDFRYLRKVWKQNCEEERLLGVSLTGIMDHPVMSGMSDIETLKSWLSELKDHAINTNKFYAEKLGINQSVAVTCVKPSGTVSQLVSSSSGIHPAFSKYYIRTVRADNKDPLCKLLSDVGVYSEPDVTKPDSVLVFYFPVKASEHAVTRNEVAAIQQLELYKIYKDFWAEHNISITVYVRENEWLDVAAWVYRNFDCIGGVSFLPHTDHIYKQAPYQEITEEEYNEWLQKTPTTIDWNLLSTYEIEDQTVNAKELACVAGVCEI